MCALLSIDGAGDFFVIIKMPRSYLEFIFIFIDKGGNSGDDV